MFDFVKKYITVGCLVLIGLGCFNSALAMNEKQDNKEKKVSEQDLEKVGEELRDILAEIRVIQHSCLYPNSCYCPRKFRNSSSEELENKQKALIPNMKTLAKKFSDEQLEEIIQEAEKRAQIEIEFTSDIGLVTVLADLFKK